MNGTREEDGRWMTRALALAARAEGRTSPNPLVGAVVVRHGVCVGEGYHHRAGEPHAEALALEEAGEAARDATVYVTLEPCAHFGRTPPCAARLIAAGVRRVVSATEDPDDRVSGRGHAVLRDAGIRVDVGVCEPEARRLNAPYFHWKRTGSPFVTLKFAMSLDGKVATRKGESKWITGERARAEAHRLRAVHDAILVGIGTVIADNPLLTARFADGVRVPLRVILDTEARIPLGARVLNENADRTVVIVGEGVDAERIRAIRARGARVWAVPRDEGRVSIPATLERLGTEDVLSVLVEGGPRVHGSFVAGRHADRVVAFVAPMILGGETAFGSVGGKGFGRLAEALRLGPWRIVDVPPDICLMSDVQKD